MHASQKTWPNEQWRRVSEPSTARITLSRTALRGYRIPQPIGAYPAVHIIGCRTGRDEEGKGRKEAALEAGGDERTMPYLLRAAIVIQRGHVARASPSRRGHCFQLGRHAPVSSKALAVYAFASKQSPCRRSMLNVSSVRFIVISRQQLLTKLVYVTIECPMRQDACVYVWVGKSDVVVGKSHKYAPVDQHLAGIF